MPTDNLRIGDGDVAATVVTPQVPSGAGALFVHGLGSDRRTNIDRAQALARAHATTCLAIDLRGHGDSVGRLSEVTPSQNLADVVAGYDALADMPGVTAARIGVCAASYGAYLSVLLAAERHVARMVLRVPALYADDVVTSTLGRRRLGDTSTSGRFVDALRALDVPTLLIESENDEVIPHSVVETYLATRPDIEHVVLAGALHALTRPEWRAEYERLLVRFFADL